jgi:hypothetical protein
MDPVILLSMVSAYLGPQACPTTPSSFVEIGVSLTLFPGSTVILISVFLVAENIGVSLVQRKQ